MPEDSGRTEWPTPINKPDLWRVAASVLLGILIAVVIAALLL